VVSAARVGSWYCPSCGSDAGDFWHQWCRVSKLQRESGAFPILANRTSCPN